jgi:hypothetical protein
MKQRFYTTIVLVLALSLGLFAQTEISVNPGDDLIAAIANASSGDIIVVKPGVHKANFDTVTQENANILINGKSLTIKGERFTNKPVIYIRAIDISGEIGELTFENIEISGLPVDAKTLIEDPTAEGEEMVGSYFVNLTPDLVSLGKLTIKGCKIRNLHRAVIRGDRAEHNVNEITVDNCIINDIRSGSSYGVFRLQSNLKLNTFTLKNSTLYNVQVGIIQSENTPADFPKTVTVENCTFYNIGGGTNSRYQFDFKSSTALNFTMRHNILGKTNAIGLEEDFDILGWRFNYEGTTATRMIANNIAPDFVVLGNSEVYQGSYADITWSQNQYNLNLDPGFADPANGNFTLPDDSPLREASLEGKVLGDPRWDPDYTNTVKALDVNKMSVYPNPAYGRVTIEVDQAAHISIYSMVGKKMGEFQLSNGKNNIDLSAYKSGMYLLLNGTIATKLIIK